MGGNNGERRERREVWREGRREVVKEGGRVQVLFNKYTNGEREIMRSNTAARLWVVIIGERDRLSGRED